ncbi:MAG: UvrD-helicase domain-containing protein, partial [Syntrophales bacterium]
MEFRIADTFTDSLAKLTGDEQKAVKTTAFDLQMNPANPGMQFHKLDKVKDRHFWSVRGGSDIRLIVHRTDASILLCYVDHHNDAYRWAERRKLETHPKTGAAQLVEIREVVREIVTPVHVAASNVAPLKEPLFAHFAAEELLDYGVPAEWLEDVLKADEDALLALTDHLPAEAAEALLELATGGRPKVVQSVAVGADPFEHPDARRRFRVMANVEELERALEYPWEKWAVFLHPAQQELIERQYGGPARISGSAGTGKTIVGLHRAVFLARNNPDARVLLTTFSETLAHTLRIKLRRLIGHEPRLGERLEVHAIDAIGRRLYEMHFGCPQMASREMVRQLLAEAAAEVSDLKFNTRFLFTEWEAVVDAWQLESWEAYRDVRRLGRKTRLPEPQRASLWSIFDTVRARLRDRGLVTASDLFNRVATQIAERAHPPFDFAIVDEAQDVGVAELRFLAALGADRPSSLFFTGDLGQRIFQQPFSWKALGIDIRGRSRTLRINYRTSHQIRMQADRLLGQELADVDGNTEERGGTISVFNGSPPIIRVFDNPEDEIEAVAAWIRERQNESVAPHEMGVFVRSEAQIDRARVAVAEANLLFTVLDDKAEMIDSTVSVGTMFLAKGLEFRAVAVMACDDEVIPLQARIGA